MISTLFQNDTFINNNIVSLFNTSIYEYDMKNAGYNLSRAYNLLPEDTLNKLGKLKKENRTVRIGKLQRNDENYKKKLKEAFKEARRMFFEANELEDNDIISIKKDAIFTTKECKNQKFLKYIDFREKHKYSSYIRLGRKIEFYYAHNTLDIKGLGEESINYHKDYMLKMIGLFFYKMESSEMKDVIIFMRNFIDSYKYYKLPVDFYRRFAVDSFYTEKETGDTFYEYWEEDKEKLDINYNYFEVLVKLIKIPL